MLVYADAVGATRLAGHAGAVGAVGAAGVAGAVGAAGAVGVASFAGVFWGVLVCDGPVSYTHLTLPTICSV
eukprot:4255198-Alexandrium_andersonii.AAC.1